MQISSRFTIALHVFACLDEFQGQFKLTSDLLAGSVNVNPVVIRKILGQLKSAGLVNVARGAGGGKEGAGERSARREGRTEGARG